MEKVAKFTDISYAVMHDRDDVRCGEGVVERLISSIWSVKFKKADKLPVHIRGAYASPSAPLPMRLCTIGIEPAKEKLSRPTRGKAPWFAWFLTIPAANV